jgi:hypothetical protein
MAAENFATAGNLEGFVTGHDFSRAAGVSTFSQAAAA